jgi:hypothetical protein
VAVLRHCQSPRDRRKTRRNSSTVGGRLSLRRESCSAPWVRVSRVTTRKSRCCTVGLSVRRASGRSLKASRPKGFPCYRRRWARRMPNSSVSSSPVTSSTNIVNKAMSPTALPPSVEPRLATSRDLMPTRTRGSIGRTPYQQRQRSSLSSRLRRRRAAGGGQGARGSGCQ